MGFTTAAMVALTAMQAVGSLREGQLASEEATAQAQIYDNQANVLDVQKGLIEEKKAIEGRRYARQKRRLAGTITARAAKGGLKLSGSPLAVLVDGLTELELDESIGRFNLDVQKYNVESEQYALRTKSKAYRGKAKSAKLGGALGAFSALLKGGANVAGRFPTKKPTGVK